MVLWGLAAANTVWITGASVTIAARDPKRAAAAVEGIAGIQIEQLDLTDPASVDAFAQRWITSRRPLHALINNAAILFMMPGGACPVRKPSSSYAQ